MGRDGSLRPHVLGMPPKIWVAVGRSAVSYIALVHRASYDIGGTQGRCTLIVIRGFWAVP